MDNLNSNDIAASLAAEFGDMLTDAAVMLRVIHSTAVVLLEQVSTGTMGLLDALQACAQASTRPDARAPSPMEGAGLAPRTVEWKWLAAAVSLRGRDRVIWRGQQ